MWQPYLAAALMAATAYLIIILVARLFRAPNPALRAGGQTGSLLQAAV